MPIIYAIDFDGTLCEQQYPSIGKPNLELIEWAKAQKEKGNKLILWTCREGELLKNAVQFCEKHGLIFDAVNENLPERILQFGTNPRKIGADYYIDDKNLEIASLVV